ncbi:hypothetical protein D9M72_413220 [compost metagenome]
MLLLKNATPKLGSPPVREGMDSLRLNKVSPSGVSPESHCTSVAVVLAGKGLTMSLISLILKHPSGLVTLIKAFSSFGVIL